MAFNGFPRRVRSIPVPSPLFGPLLEQIDDLAELKCTLRIIWLLHQKKGYPRFVTLKELLADRTLVKALARDGAPDHQQMKQAAERAVARGTLITATVKRNGTEWNEKLYMLNTESDRNVLSRMSDGATTIGHMPNAEPWDGAIERLNIFALYEDNIGILSPMLADELREAEQLYPVKWIEEAFREAVSQNKRSWRYIQRILERWERDGRSDGRPKGHPKKARYY